MPQYWPNDQYPARRAGIRRRSTSTFGVVAGVSYIGGQHRTPAVGLDTARRLGPGGGTGYGERTVFRVRGPRTLDVEGRKAVAAEDLGDLPAVVDVVLEDVPHHPSALDRSLAVRTPPCEVGC